MIISEAQLGDEIEIAEIAYSRRYDPSRSQADLEKHGFLLWTPNADIYRQVIELTDYFFIAKVEENIVGFLMCYDKKNINGPSTSTETL
jgi:hypothetical protein